MSVYQAMILYYKFEEKQPFERCLVDLIIKDEDRENLYSFKKRLVEKECLTERCTQHQINKFYVKVGYCEKVPRGQQTTLGVFIESLTNEQFNICLEFVKEKAMQLTVKLYEQIDTVFFGSPKPKNLLTSTSNETCERNDAEVTVTDVVSPTASTTTSQKIEEKGKNVKRGVKRTNEESRQDEELWENLKSGISVVRNERQQLRLDKWTQEVKEKSRSKFTAKNERCIFCTECHSEFTVNKINAINDLGKNHKKCVVSAGKYRQKKLF